MQSLAKSNQDDGATPSAVATASRGSPVGTLLRECRLRAGYDLDELSHQLRVRRPFLQAIEEGRFRDLPGPTYAIGFIKAYAEYFGLDGAEIVRRFRLEAGEPNDAKALHFPAPVAEGGTPRGAVILIGLVFAAFAYGVWYVNSIHNNAIVELITPLPERLRHLLAGDDRGGGAAFERPLAATPRGETTPAAEAPIVIVPLPRQADSPAVEAPVAVTEVPARGEDLVPAAFVALPAAASPLLPPPVAAPAPPTASPPATDAASGGRLALRAKADSWVQIRNPATRAVVLSRILKAGEAYEVPAAPGLVMTVGNAGGLEILVDGEPLPPLGRDGAVRRNVPLDAETLRRQAITDN